MWLSPREGISTWNKDWFASVMLLSLRPSISQRVSGVSNRLHWSHRRPYEAIIPMLAFILLMTSVSFCEKCNSLRFKFNDKTSKAEMQGEIGMKSSCCGKCSNINCVDFGECTCFDRFFEERQEFISKMIKDGKLPFFNKE